MIKRTYLAILSVAIVSVLLGSLFINNVILAQSGSEYDPWIDNNEDGIIDVNDLVSIGQAYGSSGDPTRNVNVTNFPLDEEGNLKVTSRPSQVVTVESELNFSYPAWPSYDSYKTIPISTRGYREFYVYWSYKNQTSSAQCWVNVISIVDGIEVLTNYEASNVGVGYSEWDGTPKNASSRYLVWAPTIKIGVGANGETEAGWLLVSVSLYLRN